MGVGGGEGVTKCKVEGLQGCGYGRRGGGSPSVRWRDYKAVGMGGGEGVTKCKVEGLQGCGYGRRGGGH